VPEVVAVAA